MTTDTDKKMLARELNDFAATISYRAPGAVVHVVDSVDMLVPPAPAWFIPALDDVFIHLDAAGYEHEYRDDKSKAVLRGLVCHELAHSKWSAWLNGVDVPKEVAGTVTMFEEMRIENRAADKGGNTVRGYIRAALPLAIGDTEDVPPRRSAVARLWALGYGRVLTSIVSEADVVWIDQAARTLLGDDDVDFMRDILQEAVALHLPQDKERMFEIAAQWVDLVGDADLPSCDHGYDGGDKDGDPSDEEAEGKDATGKARAKSASEDADDEDGDVDSDIARDVLDSVSPDEKIDEGALDPDDVDMIVSEVVKMSEAISGDWNTHGKLTMADPLEEARRAFGGSKGKWKPDTPTHVEFAEIARTSKALEAMSIPAITKVPNMNMVPPGRLRSREAVRASAERSNGTMTTAKPWRTTRRTHSHVKPIVIGIATDISGSMKWAERSVAQFAYVWTHAGQRVGARTAAVTFGDRVERIAAPGEVLNSLVVRAANGSTEVADKALAALDGVLHLSSHNNAAKLLIIVSDAMLVIDRETDRVVKRLTEMRDAGTTVIWVTNGSRIPRIEKVATVVYAREGGAFKAIQDASIKALDNLTKGN